MSYMKIVSYTTNELTQGFGECLQFSDQNFSSIKSKYHEIYAKGRTEVESYGYYAQFIY